MSENATSPAHQVVAANQHSDSNQGNAATAATWRTKSIAAHQTTRMHGQIPTSSSPQQQQMVGAPATAATWRTKSLEPTRMPACTAKY